MSASAEKTFKNLIGIQTKAGRPSKVEEAKKTQATNALIQLQTAIRGKIARKTFNKEADLQWGKTWTPMQQAKEDAKKVLTNAIKAKKARTILNKKADAKLVQLDDQLHEAVVARMKASIASLDKQIAMVGKSKLAIRKGVKADKIERPIIWGKMIIEIPDHMYYRKSENFTQKLDEQIINNGRIMNLKGVPSIIIRTADISAPRIVNDGSIESIAREKELNKEVKKYEAKGKEVIQKLDDEVQQYEEKGALIINAKTNAAKTILDAYRASKAKQLLQSLKKPVPKRITTPVINKLVKILAQKKKIGK
jgi:hypothetical protein